VLSALGLQGIQWAVGLVVVRASWPGHPRKKKKPYHFKKNCEISRGIYRIQKKKTNITRRLIAIIS
jgi:hypothetical protein